MPEEPPAAENISVYARIRAGLVSSDELGTVEGAPEKVRARNLEFNLDHAFDTNATQEQLYDRIAAGLVTRVTDGFNACIICYGQTGSGKTFTMLGPEGVKLDGSGGAQAGLGLAPRACLQLFKTIPSGFTVTTSYMEVYNDTVNDLFNPDKNAYMQLGETEPGHVEPLGLTRRPVANTGEVMESIAFGDSRRVIAPMAMNPRSSRGHGIISIEVVNAEGQRHGRLVLVDLAGMESSKKSAPVEGASNTKVRKEEAKRINMSLLALSSVVNALASKGAMRVPFRDSKLTRLLQSSLAGNCKAAFVVTLRSEKQNIEEAINTLKFAQRAKSVQATVIKNDDARKPTGAAAANKKLEAELLDAQNQLKLFHQKLAGEESEKQALSLQVQTLMKEMLDLQQEYKDPAVNKRSSVAGPPGEDTGRLQARIVELEARCAELEAENRHLRQRDVMHRLIELDGNQVGPNLGINKKMDLATFQPMAMGGFGMVRDDGGLHEREFNPRAGPRFERVNDGRSRGWTILRTSWRIAKKKSRVAPAPPPPKKKKYKPAWRPKTREEKAAVKIQSNVRGFLTRKELDYDPYADLYDMYDDEY